MTVKENAHLQFNLKQRHKKAEWRVTIRRIDTKMVEGFSNRKTSNAKTAILKNAIKNSGVLQLSNYLTIITPELSGSSSILNSSNSISIHEDGDGKRFLYREFLNKGLIPA